ncbi:MAG: tetratricopeptide repeat protein [Vibrionaceae bacterium]
MSELNQILTKLCKAEGKSTQLVLAPIAKPKKLWAARVLICGAAGFTGLSGIAWAIASVQPMMLSAPLNAQPMTDLVTLQPSPTQKMVTASTRTAMQLPKTPSLEQIVQSDSLQTKKPSHSTPKRASSTRQRADSGVMSVKTVELSGPQLAQLAYEQAQSYIRAGDIDKVLEQLWNAVRYDPSHIEATKQLAASLFARQQLAQAQSVLRQGIAQNPAVSELRVLLAKIYQQSGRNDLALDALLVNENNLDSGKHQLMVARASLAQTLNKVALAKKSFLWLAQREPSDGRWWLGVAIAAERTGERSLAYSSYRKALAGEKLSLSSREFTQQRLAGFSAPTTAKSRS